MDRVPGRNRPGEAGFVHERQGKRARNADQSHREQDRAAHFDHDSGGHAITRSMQARFVVWIHRVGTETQIAVESTIQMDGEYSLLLYCEIDRLTLNVTSGTTPPKPAAISADGALRGVSLAGRVGAEGLTVRPRCR